jgi:mannose-6-phosphate isomerase-like protein (cupin superfamily)
MASGLSDPDKCLCIVLHSAAAAFLSLIEIDPFLRNSRNRTEQRIIKHGISPIAFMLSAREGRTTEPLNIFGAPVLVKLMNADTNGTAAVFHQIVPPMSGPPLHRHSREDEWFCVLDGEITAEIDGERTILLRAGSSAFAPRGTAHACRNFSGKTAQMLVW